MHLHEGCDVIHEYHMLYLRCFTYGMFCVYKKREGERHEHNIYELIGTSVIKCVRMRLHSTCYILHMPMKNRFLEDPCSF